MPKALDLLPLPVRARRYREMAEAAFRLSAESPATDIKASYLSLAASWHALASSLEHELGEEIASTVRENLTGVDA